MVIYCKMTLTLLLHRKITRLQATECWQSVSVYKLDCSYLQTFASLPEAIAISLSQTIIVWR